MDGDDMRPGETPAATSPAPDATPTPPEAVKARLLYAHGFIDENGTHRMWKAGDVVSDPAEIAMLTERGADLESIG